MDQEAVSGSVPQGVVHLLEVVEVAIQYRPGRVGGADAARRGPRAGGRRDGWPAPCANSTAHQELGETLGRALRQERMRLSTQERGRPLWPHHGPPYSEALFYLEPSTRRGAGPVRRVKTITGLDGGDAPCRHSQGLVDPTPERASAAASLGWASGDRCAREPTPSPRRGPVPVQDAETPSARCSRTFPTAVLARRPNTETTVLHDGTDGVFPQVGACLRYLRARPKGFEPPTF